MSTSSLRRALEEELAANLDELATHAAYADLLSEMDDPRGEYIQVQLGLEDSTLTSHQRDELTLRERELWTSHRAQWLGEIAPHALDTENVRFSFWRGWLETLEIRNLDLEFARALRDAPEARMLCNLTIESARDTTTEHEPADNIPDDDERQPGFWALVGGECLSNVRNFQLGEDQGDDLIQQAGGHWPITSVVPLVRSMPRLRELSLFSRASNLSHLFTLTTFDNLRVLKLYHHEELHRLDILAANPHLRNLTHLLIHPHALGWLDTEDEHAGFRQEDGYLPLSVVEALLQSKHLPHLTHLQLRCSSMGDDGAKAIVESGILKRLKHLDLRHGRITDAGARLLATSPDIRSLELLDLSYNALTPAGVNLLERLDLPCRIDNQHTSDHEDHYLYEGEFE